MKFLVLLSVCIMPFYLLAQKVDYETKDFKFEQEKRWSPNQVQTNWNLQLVNMESPFEGNATYRQHLHALKKKIALQNNVIRNDKNTTVKSSDYFSESVTRPIVGKSFEGNGYSYSAPNDNTMAISNDGILISAINTNILFYDTKNDSIIKTISLNLFSDTLSHVSSHQYDPKIIYDYKEDRFVLVYLAGSSSDANHLTDIIVAFSQNSDPMQDWSFYSLPGNPLSAAPNNDTSWTDYPAISLSNDELFITGNLLRYGGSWQTSFKQSIIWQIDKYDGFAGDSIDVRLYHGINEGGLPLRNLHPVRGGNAFYGPEMYFLSNRNFALQSDTVYLLQTDGRISDNPSLSIRLLRADLPYGAPPDAHMKGNRFLATNDARVLGAFYQNNHIQFVGNSIDSRTGKAAFYHGFINDLQASSVKGHIISGIEFTDSLYSTDTLEFGYPNISYCGIMESSKHSMINFNFSSADISPGFCAIFGEKEGSYSDLDILVNGTSPISVLSGNLQRWGDYSGSQPKYDEPGKVWVSGTFGHKPNFYKVYGTWISELTSSVEDIEPAPPITDFSTVVYPNPSIEEGVHFVFDLPTNDNVKIELFDIHGKKIALLYDAPAKQGRNKLYFSTQTLQSGMYIIRIYNSTNILHSDKFTVL